MFRQLSLLSPHPLTSSQLRLYLSGNLSGGLLFFASRSQSLGLGRELQGKDAVYLGTGKGEVGESGAVERGGEGDMPGGGSFHLLSPGCLAGGEAGKGLRGVLRKWEWMDRPKRALANLGAEFFWPFVFGGGEERFSHLRHQFGWQTFRLPHSLPRQLPLGLCYYPLPVAINPASAVSASNGRSGYPNF